ncbi:fructosamine kinase [Chloroherpeton thalassium ATCC 35110]|uniref:Fructosamine kinase n=1 Tax=Chloroherpeton thalassium (strain ATCC 35110 / GB-78) TaxID=517418 RepID=B3QWK9_CHLT3|nr:fructosamine kinase family protein [Chloroherpeton thalassium]ACF14769.1 fructosamine kinase [Chloroherpeton thalassium ATCC 35110]
MLDARQQQIESVLGHTPENIRSLSGGCVGEVYQVRFKTNPAVVAKVASGGNKTLQIEGDMLTYLREKTALPVPEVLFNSPALLLMSFVEGNSPCSRKAEEHGAELLAELHQVKAEQFGFDYDTLIGGLHQPNPKYDSWISFFAEQRLCFMARTAYDAGQLPKNSLARFERFAEKLDTLIAEPKHPSLIHGDIWGGNVLIHADKIAAFIDPAIYFAHPEIELAFITLFGTFGERFFDCYSEICGLEPKFFEVRRDIYNLYPLLVHTRLFGGHYRRAAERIIERHGF